MSIGLKRTLLFPLAFFAPYSAERDAPTPIHQIERTAELSPGVVLAKSKTAEEYKQEFLNQIENFKILEIDKTWLQFLHNNFWKNMEDDDLDSKVRKESEFLAEIVPKLEEINNLIQKLIDLKLISRKREKLEEFTNKLAYRSRLKIGDRLNATVLLPLDKVIFGLKYILDPRTNKVNFDSIGDIEFNLDMQGMKKIFQSLESIELNPRSRMLRKLHRGIHRIRTPEDLENAKQRFKEGGDPFLVIPKGASFA